ncbi:Sulfotransferase domain-containing protein [Cyclobacterium xiamenense]|uniref:Sulfotransferase domain-containing protein n=1 Tax=Cyclobacterium xiamenense TaxID=1297121 RepID=A0A1H6ZBB5_9BACT|nr:sulfotransferase domain-containing protein [Cyclobacterium xiamenense]SEJ50731.1 Sulfotransferase domain-containing protein [Cyclobacterium xiamenense]
MIEFKIHSIWTRNRLTIKSSIASKIVLTKFVRANLLVPYFSENFRFKHNPIFLVRHPIDTYLSQIRAFGKLGEIPVQGQFPIPKCINNDRFIEHSPFINQLETKLEVMIAYWCLNNCITYRNLDTTEICLVFYLDLLLKPREEIKRILQFIGFQEYENLIDTIDFRRPSSTNFDGSFVQSSEDHLWKNFQKLDIKTKDKVQKIFDYFGFKVFSAYSPFPLTRDF